MAASRHHRGISGGHLSLFPYCILIDAAGNVAAHGSLRENNADILARYRELREAAAADRPAEPQSDTSPPAQTDDVSLDGAAQAGGVQGTLVSAADGSPVAGARV